jgi:hypothetical protein
MFAAARAQGVALPLPMRRGVFGKAVKVNPVTPLRTRVKARGTELCERVRPRARV